MFSVTFDAGDRGDDLPQRAGQFGQYAVACQQFADHAQFDQVGQVSALVATLQFGEHRRVELFPDGRRVAGGCGQEAGAAQDASVVSYAG